MKNEIKQTSDYKTPITKEFLEKNGFTYCVRDGGFYLFEENDYDDCLMEIILFNVNNEDRNNQLHIEYACNGELMLHLMSVNNVEHLQNIFKDCGIKKTLEL
jgi:hypothetical protein